MVLHFWGVRGSLAAPLLPEQVQAKISAVVQRITARDLESIDAKEKFITSLPQWLFSTVGGNSSCVEVTTGNGETLVLDCGTGVRELGKKHFPPEKNVFHVLFSHFHWDHIQGLPFFTPAFNPDNEVHLYSTFPAAKKILEQQMTRPYFPVPMEAFTKKMYFHTIKQGVPFFIGDTEILCKKMRHPGNSYSYSFYEQGKKFVYATDVELVQSEFKRLNDGFFTGADVLVLDSQYTVEDAHVKANWGHSAFTYAVDFAMMTNAKKLFLYHHEPNYDDKKIYSILESAKWYADFAGKKDLVIDVATEGTDILI